MPVDSSSLPEGWKKYVIQKKMPNEKSKWIVFFSHETTRKWFSCKSTLVKYLEKENLSNIKAESFEFSIPKDLRKIISIWKHYQIKNSKRKLKTVQKLKENVPFNANDIQNKPIGHKSIKNKITEAKEFPEKFGMNGEKLPYQQLDLSIEPQKIANSLIEGVHIPAPVLLIDSSNLPTGWKKFVYLTTGTKWDVVFTDDPSYKKMFSCKKDLEEYFKEHSLPYNIDDFDFSLDEQMTKIKQIWLQYRVKERKDQSELLPYLQIDLTADPQEIAEKLIEGVNFPGMHKPMLIDSSGLPEGWQKKVVLRKPQKEGSLRFEILVSHPEITKGTNFTGKNKLQNFFDKKQIPMTAESFDFHNDPKIQKLGQIWKAYRMSPSLKKESMAMIKNEKLIVDNQTLPIDPATVKIEPGIHDNSDNWSELSLEEEVLSLEEESSVLR